MPLYDRRLEAICAATRLGSFTKAAEALSISTPALVKQINSFEAEEGLTLFYRTHLGCTLTPAGKSLVEDARAAINQSDDALRRARAIGISQNASVRLGVSYLCPAQKTLDAWPKIFEDNPQLKLELVPIGDIYDKELDIVGTLGRDIDLIQAAWSPARWEGRCQILPVGSVPLSIDVSSSDPLAQRQRIGLANLAGRRVHMLTRASDAMDELKGELLAHGVEVVDVERYDLALFNEVVERSEAVITSGAWAGRHPQLASIPLDTPHRTTCTLLYPMLPSPAVASFIQSYRQLLEQGQDKTSSASA